MEKVSDQSESQTQDVFEARASDSDTGDSLFLTQSVTSPSRTVKRQRPSNTKAHVLNQEEERDSDSNAQCEDSSNSDSDTRYADLLCRRKSLGKRHGTTGRPPRPRRRRPRPKKMDLTFLKTSGLRSGCQNSTVELYFNYQNSEMGGFFKCIQRLLKGQEDRRRELSPSFLDSEWEQNNMEENEDDDDDIRKVNTDYFVLTTPKRNRQTWLPSLKWKTVQALRKSPEKSKKNEEQHEKCSQTRKDAKDLMEPEDDTNVHNKSSSVSRKESQSRKSPARSSLSPCSFPSCLSPDKIPIVQSLFMDHQEEHSENWPQVLVTCSQSQSLDWHRAQKTNQACENLMEPVDEMAVEETQWANSVEQDEDETQISEDNPVDRDGRKDAVCSENISFHEHQDEDIHESLSHEPVENEDLGSVSEGLIGSQDLFQEPNKQTSPLKETNVENDIEEDLESGVMIYGIDSVKKKKRRCSLILADMEADCVTHFKSQRIQLTETNSSTARDICHERREKDDTVEHEHPSLPLEDYSTGSRRCDFSSPSKDSLMVRQNDKPETPLFVYGGLKFLKRKKGKKTQVHDSFDKPTPVQADPGLDEVSDIVKRKKRKKDKNDVEPVDTLTEISVSADLCLSVQDCSVVCASGSGIKTKKKRKKGRNDELLEEPVDALPKTCAAADSISSFQDSCMVSASIGRSKLKKKGKKDKHAQPMPLEHEWIGEEEIPGPGSTSLVSIHEETEQMARTDLSSFGISHEVSQLDSSTQVNKDLVQCDGQEPHRKKKKRKSCPEMVASQCSEGSHSSHGITTVKKRKQKHMDDVGEVLTASRRLEEPLGEIHKISANKEIQPINSVDLKMDDTVPPRKKKKKQQQHIFWEENLDVEVSLVETTEQAETPDPFQDSEEGLVGKVKKQKKKLVRTEDEASKSTPESLTPGCGEMTSDIPSTRSETEGIGESDCFSVAEPVKKKKKKKRNTEHTTVVEESDSGQKLGNGNPAPGLKTQLPNDAKEKKRQGNKDEGSECSQEILHSEDTIEPEEKKKKKKKKKRLVETDNELFPEVVEHGIPSESSETIIKEKKKKKKTRKDRVDAGENESLDILSETSAAEEPRNVLVTCHANEDSVSCPVGELLEKKKKKKKKVRDTDNDVEAKIGSEHS